MATISENTQADFDNAEAIVIDMLQTAHPGISLRRGSVLRELLVRPMAELYAADAKRLNESMAARSLLLMKEAGTASDDEINAILSNFSTSLYKGKTAAGTLMVQVEEESVYVVPDTAIFSTDDGREFKVSRTYTITPADVSGPEYIELKCSETGLYYFLLPVQAVSPGSMYNVDAGVRFSMNPEFNGLVAATSYEKFVGGLDAQTIGEAISELESAVSLRGMASRAAMVSTLLDRNAGNFGGVVLACSIAGYGDAEQLRDKSNVFGVSTGGKVDLFVRTYVDPPVVTLKKAADIAISRNAYILSFSNLEVPGFHGVKSVILADDVPGKSGVGTDDTVSSRSFRTEIGDSGLAAGYGDHSLSGDQKQYAFTAYRNFEVLVKPDSDLRYDEQTITEFSSLRFSDVTPSNMACTPDGKFLYYFFGSKKRRIYKYDSNGLVKTIDFPSSYGEYVYGMVVGNDGLIYCAIDFPNDAVTGIIYSTDDGDSFTLVDSDFNPKSIGESGSSVYGGNFCMCRSNDCEVIYLADTTNADDPDEIYRFRLRKCNGFGGSWSVVNNNLADILPDDANYFDIRGISTADGNTVYLLLSYRPRDSYSAQRSLFVSADGGVTWTRMSLRHFDASIFEPKELCASDGGSVYTLGNYDSSTKSTKLIRLDSSGNTLSEVDIDGQVNRFVLAGSSCFWFSIYTGYGKPFTIARHAANTQKDFLVSLYACPSVAEIQNYVDRPDVKSLRDDIIVRSAPFCLVQISAVVGVAKNKSHPDVTEMKKAVVDYVNSRSFVPRLTASEIVAVLSKFDILRVETMYSAPKGFKMQGRIIGADGSQVYLTGPDLDIDAVADSKNLVSRNTVCFTMGIEDIDIQFVEE